MAQSKQSAGLLMVRWHNDQCQVLLGHPGGPYFQKKDAGVWSIPKGEPEEGEDYLHAAQREFHEETGLTAVGPFTELTPIQQKGGKTVHAWAFKGDCDPAALTSNTFAMEWPPKSGRQVEFPEIDRAEFFDLPVARQKINPAQVALLDELAEKFAR
ncbi:NUDIX hydrolase [Blastopirellula marina]|uniref:NUDIX hydrolase n=1 Tax=Blastopirellula marina TaxID=124 RepID=A0A2S8FMJ8_9BACT|nr:MULTISPECIES: NUDIX domain-containing protein [Pirellulaceae]PQO33405.1 NUDIX hydrolase [Blastopirellula marina]RCS52495.1 NUDIX domain-containing protein [Bremerella cremea]